MNTKDKERSLLDAFAPGVSGNLPAEQGRALVACPSCHGKSRVPADRGPLRVTCPHCGTQANWTPQTQPHGPGDHGRLPDRVHIPLRCYATGGRALATFRLHPSPALYRFQHVRRADPAEQAAEYPKADHMADVPFSLLDWTGAACPFCHAALSYVARCGACDCAACESGISTRHGRDYLRCACGSEGEIVPTDDFRLPTSSPAPAGQRDAGPGPLAIDHGPGHSYPAIGRFGGH